MKKQKTAYKEKNAKFSSDEKYFVEYTFDVSVS